MGEPTHPVGSMNLRRQQPWHDMQGRAQLTLVGLARRPLWRAKSSKDANTSSAFRWMPRW